jgi:hypothetical protein
MFNVLKDMLLAPNGGCVTLTKMEAMVKSSIRKLIFPLLSTLFFLALLVSLNTLYQPFNPSNATPIPIDITVNYEASLETAPETTSAIK